MSGGRWSFAHRQKAPQKTSLVGWLRGESVMSGVDIRLRFWLECSRWKAESDGADICAVRWHYGLTLRLHWHQYYFPVSRLVIFAVIPIGIGDCLVQLVDVRENHFDYLCSQIKY